MKIMKRTLLIAAMAVFTLTHVPFAQAVTPEEEKKALVQRVLPLWLIEESAITMVQRPATNALTQANAGLQGRLTAEKQAATMKSISEDVQKYVDAATPIAKSNAMRLKEPTLAPLLMQNFSAEELRQLIAFLESPVKKKFEALVPQFTKTYGEKVAESSRAAIDPLLATMSKEVGLKMRASTMGQ